MNYNPITSNDPNLLPKGVGFLYKDIAKQARIKVLDMIHKAKTSHVASNFSCIDIATVLYANLKPNDEVVWSKGWAAATIYYFLNQQEKITDDEMASFPNPPFLGLAETTVPGVLVNGGSVGHGLPVAVGIAYAKKLSGDTGRVYCIMSDGELNEGSVWEAVMVAAHLKLDNLIAIIDKNGWQAMGRTEDVIDLGNIADKFIVFGWRSFEVDGHDFKQIERAITKLSPLSTPTCIIAETIKGKGVSFFEDHLLYHYKHVDEEDYKKALEELNA